MLPQSFLSVVILALLLSSCRQESKFVWVDDSEIDPEKLAFVTELSKKMLDAQKAGGHYPLSKEEATPKMAEALDEQLQKKSYEQIRSAFGDYRNLEFHHMEKPKDGSLYEIYRFKGSFDPKANVEVRATLDANGKLAGFFVRPWRD